MRSHSFCLAELFHLRSFNDEHERQSIMEQCQSGTKQCLVVADYPARVQMKSTRTREATPSRTSQPLRHHSGWHRCVPSKEWRTLMVNSGRNRIPTKPRTKVIGLPPAALACAARAATQTTPQKRSQMLAATTIPEGLAGRFMRSSLFLSGFFERKVQGDGREHRSANQRSTVRATKIP
ncbi:MAG: hypothetical protein PWP23_328 [Candidatus Sumerlaeota bacterium]|nr:hypothetical protein [Candidatus Sumerlaeota bacterium]